MPVPAAGFVSVRHVAVVCTLEVACCVCLPERSEEKKSGPFFVESIEFTNNHQKELPNRPDHFSNHLFYCSSSCCCCSSAALLLCKHAYLPYDPMWATRFHTFLPVISQGCAVLAPQLSFYPCSVALPTPLLQTCARETMSQSCQRPCCLSEAVDRCSSSWWPFWAAWCWHHHLYPCLLPL